MRLPKTLTLLFILTLLTCRLDKVVGRQCGFPGKPRNGSSLTVAQVSRPGDTVHYSCRSGYTLFGEEERVCLDSGIWAGRQPLCELNLAMGKSAIMSGTLWNYRASLAVDGNPDTCCFTPRTTEQRWWQIDLASDKHVGSVALVINKDTYQELTVFVIQLLSKSEARYKPCATFKGRFQTPRLLFPCHGGEGQKGQYVYIRDDRKDQDYFGLCEVQVFLYIDGIACGEPEKPVHGHVFLNGDNTKAIYSCEPGFMLMAEPNRTCEADGHWKGHAPQCEAIDCGYPQIFPHTEVELVNQTTLLNAVAVYSCKTGYSIASGNSSSSTICLHTGVWEQIEIYCLPDGDLNLPVKLTGKEWSVVSENDDIDEEGINKPGIISLGIFFGLLIVMLAVTVIFLVRRFLVKMITSKTLQSSNNDLILKNTKANIQEDLFSSNIDQPQCVNTSAETLQSNNTLPLFPCSKDLNSHYNILESFTSMSSYNSDVINNIDDDHNTTRIKMEQTDISQDMTSQPMQPGYKFVRIKPQASDSYNSIQNLRQINMESSYDNSTPNSLFYDNTKLKGRIRRFMPSALKFILRPQSKFEENDSSDPTSTEIIALYTQVDKYKNKRYHPSEYPESAKVDEKIPKLVSFSQESGSST